MCDPRTSVQHLLTAADTQDVTPHCRFTFLCPSEGPFGSEVGNPEVLEFTSGERFSVTRTVLCLENGYRPEPGSTVFGVNVLVPEAELARWRLAPKFLSQLSGSFESYGSITHPIATKVNVSGDNSCNDPVNVNNFTSGELDSSSTPVSGTAVTGHKIVVTKSGKYLFRVPSVYLIFYHF